MSNEPVLTAASVGALVAAVLSAVALFGLPITPDQQKAVVLVVMLAFPIVAAFVARSQVTPVAKASDPPPRS